MWWNDRTMTVAKFFTFPNPINIVESRCHGLCLTVLIPLVIFFDMSGFAPVMDVW